MKLENQVVSLELAKKLKKLGVKQESLYWWVIDEEKTAMVYHNGETTVWEGPKTIQLQNSAYRHWGDLKLNKVSAFTVAELGEMLPTTIYDQSGEYFLNLGATSENIKYGNTREFTVSYVGIEKDIIHIHEHTEADARAKMLIYLLENKLISTP